MGARSRHPRGGVLHGREGMNGLNGHTKAPDIQVRVVTKIRLENAPNVGAVFLLMGEDRPELAAQLTPEDCRKLAGALTEHARSLEAAGRKIILPGEDLTL